MINNSNIELTKRLIKKEERPITVKAHDDTYNRKILEYGKFDLLEGIEQGKRKNSLRSLDSGLNEIMARIAAKNSVSIGIDLSEIRNLPKKEKASVLARIAQNIKLCRKSGVKIRVINTKDKKDSQCFLISLGSSTAQASSASASQDF